MSTPVVEAWRDGARLWFWCRNCNRAHTHGVCSGDPSCPNDLARMFGAGEITRGEWAAASGALRARLAAAGEHSDHL